ncbi:MAG: CBS domain-containing protein [Betaproteobacteria bacterium]|nr:CBS domain-containing protein [Betaproteobacteria bacterium]
MTQPRTVRSIIEGQELLTAPATMWVCDAARLMRERKVGAILVLEDGKLAGIFTERDALFRVVAEQRAPTTTSLAAVMTRNPHCIHPDKPFAAALDMMHAGQFRHVPVVEDDRPIGMVSARDAMGPELEDFMYSLIVDQQATDVLA